MKVSFTEAGIILVRLSEISSVCASFKSVSLGIHTMVGQGSLLHYETRIKDCWGNSPFGDFSWRKSGALMRFVICLLIFFLLLRLSLRG